MIKRVWCAFGAFCALAGAGEAQERVNLSFLGTPGILDMPTANVQPDGQITLTTARFARTTHNTFSFQIAPRLGGSFRYTIARDFSLSEGAPSDDYFDRSFDIYYALLREGAVRPALSLGVRDFGGTGVYSSEFLVATKRVVPDLKLSFGIGWGRLGTQGGFRNPLAALSPHFDNRPDTEGTGRFQPGRLFTGDAALFAGAEWAVTPRLIALAEYSSDAYVSETGGGLFERKSPINLGVKYRTPKGLDLGVSWLYGSELGLSVSYGFNPRTPPVPGGIEEAPPSLLPRLALPRAWSAEGGTDLSRGLKAQGLKVEALSISDGVARIRVANLRYDAGAQAIGRTARVMANTMPASVETFVIEPVVAGLPTAAITIARADLEALEGQVGGSRALFTRAKFGPPLPGGMALMPGAYPVLSWGLNGYVSPSFFDPDNPVRVDGGIELAADWMPAPGFLISGALRQPLIGNRDEATRISDSVLPHVRSDTHLYDTQSDLELSYLTADWLFRPGRNLFGRLTVGYLERMFGGVSTEILWKPVASRLAMGAELNYAVQREFDLGLGFQDYAVVTGHASAYYDLGRGYLAQVDVGRYLAGDWGATFALDREFNNGVRVGAFFTLTDVPFDDFGEGAFDKGIRVSIPLSWLSGQPSQQGFGVTLRPVTRDGGARLDVRNRLYDLTRGYHQGELGKQWARFWR